MDPIAIETKRSGQVIDRTFPGEMLVKEFNQEFGVILDKNEDQTLSELLEGLLEHHAEVGDSITVDSFELIAKEVSLMEIKSVTIRSIVS